MKELTTASFQQEVLDSDVPVLVDFWSPTCGPCRQIAPVVEQLAEEADGRFRVGKVNVFDQQDLGVRYRITAVHTLVGYQDKRKLLAVMQPLIGQPVKQATV